MKAIPRIVMGLIALATGLLLVFDLGLRIFPTEADKARQTRQRIAQSMAVQAAALLQAQDLRSVERTLQALQGADPDVLSIGLRRSDGVLLSHAGPHLAAWKPERAGTANALSVDIHERHGRWGALEVVYRPVHASGTRWLLGGAVPLILLFGLFGSALFYLYLRRMLAHLDPSTAVPERVHAAFDVLTEAVAVLDVQGRILLANRAFVALQPMAERQPLVGSTLSGLSWLERGAAGTGLDQSPWEVALRTRLAQTGAAYRIVADGRVTTSLSLNCAPLFDERQVLRGCIVTATDLTEIERSHEQLLEVLGDLAASKQALEIKNHELEMMATQDVLSGCLNRRALFERGQHLLAEAAASGREVACVLADIDHFKAINDRLGHACGDDAIRLFGALLREHVSSPDLIGRYGGEEFCVVLSGADSALAARLAERMREHVASSLGVGPPDARMRITASFGVASATAGALTLDALIDRADQAMYEAKRSGRNRVAVAARVNDPELAAELEITA